MQTKDTQESRLRHYAIIIGIVINIFVAGASWGSLWMKVDALDARVTRIERNEDSTHKADTPSRHKNFIGPTEAIADTLKTIGEHSNVSNPNRPH